jgi:hypothetical protein
MFYVGLILGLVLGAGGYYLYDKYWGSVEARIAKLAMKLEALKAKL